ncbi:MAG: cobalt-zinc-cadmium efflux system protein [Pseudonocardiales bacterium]|jgi:cobalt-zinc-cadmium efflux system protein|nr:cobalt-zinc-cadmium efflux system protein [Pseudonocardiales bacterium]
MPSTLNSSTPNVAVAEDRGHAHGHAHATPVAVTAATDRKWLFASLSVIVAFMSGEVVVGLMSGSLALIADAGHMLTDAAALGLAIAASKIAQRPAKGSYTYGFTRIDAVSAQANGITLLILAAWFCVQAVQRLFSPPDVEGVPVIVVALIGVVVNLVAMALAGRANQASLNVRGALAHVVNDLWAFAATAIAGAIIVATGWARADAVASLVVAALMVYSGFGLIRASGRVFLEAAPVGVDPRSVGADMAAVAGVNEVHDLHVWDLGGSEPALSAHVVVSSEFDCHDVAASVRSVLEQRHHISHATLQADHRRSGQDVAEDPCASAGHGPGYVRLDSGSAGLTGPSPTAPGSI